MPLKDKKKQKAYIKQWRKDNLKKIEEHRKQYYKNNKEKIDRRSEQWRENNREYIEKYNKDHKEERKQYYKQYNKNNSGERRRSAIKRRYGLSYKEWQKMWDNQDGRCIICGKSFIKPSNALIDHNHKTGYIRGLLCIKCNTGIGYLNDDPKLTAKATEYLLGDK